MKKKKNYLPKTWINFENLLEVKIYESVYNIFKNEFEKREKGGEQPNYNSNDNENDTKDNKVRLENNNINEQDTKKKRKCC